MAPKDCKEQSSHKIIEKRRRDRINACLSELSQTVPSAFSKQTTGKLEKAEILEMTVEYLRTVQATEVGSRYEHGDWFSADIWTDFMHHYQAGYNDCIRETMRYMTDVEGVNVNDDRCLRILTFLQTRFRPENSVNSGVTCRDALCRLSSRGRGPMSNTQSNESHMRFSPYFLTSRDIMCSTNAPGSTFLTQSVSPIAMSLTNGAHRNMYRIQNSSAAQLGNTNACFDKVAVPGEK